MVDMACAHAPMLAKAASGARDLTWWLADIEEELLSNRRRWCEVESGEAGSAERWNIYQGSLNLISRACGYKGQTFLKRIGRDYQCARFQQVPRWGRTRYEYNEEYSLHNHITMAEDRPRVEAFRQALSRVAEGRRMLDLGCGPFCLLSRLALRAGASSVDCVEQNSRAVKHATSIFASEARGEECRGLRDIGASLVGYGLTGREHSSGWGGPSASVSVAGGRELHLFHGFSSEVPLGGGYDLVVHEILGHIASSEGVAHAICDLRSRGLLASDCVFVPRRATTFFAPTEQVDLTCLERILVNFDRKDGTGIKCLTKYHVDQFPYKMNLATPGVFEDLDFGGDLQTRRHHTVRFTTERGGVFDGLHFHMVADMDGRSCINTLIDQTSWSTTYVKLLEPGIFLPAGARIVCESSLQLDRPAPLYSVRVFVDGGEHAVAEFSWSGCTG